MTPTTHTIGEAAAAQSLTIELLVIVDYSDYKVWYERTSSIINSQKRHSDKINNIKLHVASLVKSNNVAYESLKKYSLAINAKLVDVLIMETPEQSPWTETVKYLNGSQEELVAVDVFKTLEPYPKSLQATIPHDHAMILTQYKIHLANKTGGYALGVAEKRAECSFRSVSIVQDIGFSSADVMAHELGHSLGCDHDGEGDACREEDGYIMTPGHEIDYMNLWQFSTCSVNNIKLYIHNITARHVNCMDKYQNLHPTDLSRNASWFGELYSADEQCDLYTKGSHFCRKHYEGNFTDVCQLFLCTRPSNDTCYYTSYGAGDGTPCGHGKWCMSNRCVDAPKPVLVPETRVYVSKRMYIDLEQTPTHRRLFAVDYYNCIAGDQTVPVKDNKSCSELIKTDPNQCNNHVIKQKCCATCRTATTTSTNVNEQCVATRGSGSSLCWWAREYQGNATLSDVMCGKLACFGATDHSLCWTSMADDKTVCGNHKWCQDGQCVYNKDFPASHGCEYGDKSSYCYTGIPSNQHWCYIVNTTAESCTKIARANNPDCKYGDRAANCQTDIPNNHNWCYDAKNAHLCCKSCSKVARVTLPGCEFGDRYTDCLPTVPNNPGLCYDNSTRGHCYFCWESCSKHAINLRPDCRYGDHYNNCDATLCLRYSDEVRQKCCAACKDIPIIG